MYLLYVIIKNNSTGLIPGKNKTLRKMKNRIKMELGRNVLIQSVVSEKYFIIRDGNKVGFNTLKKAKENKMLGEDIFQTQVGFNGKLYSQKVTW